MLQRGRVILETCTMSFKSPADFTARGWRRPIDEEGPSLAAFVKGLIGVGLVWVFLGLAFDMAVPNHSPSRAIFALTAQILSALFVMFAVIWLAIRHRAAMLASLRPASWRVIAFATLVGAVLMVVNVFIYSRLARYGFVPRSLFSFDHLPNFHDVPSLPAQFLVNSALIVSCVPIVEEILFRGVVLTWLARKMPVFAAIAASSLIFAVVHLRMFQTPAAGGWIITAGIFVIGAVAAVLAVKTRSLWPGMFLHAAYNATLAVMLVFVP
jgi:membrane protease YdiL (CAAX protease family)